MPKNKIAIVTGGTSGIGYAIAKLFVETGTTVVIASSRQSAVDETIAALHCDGIAADLSKAEDCKALVDYTLEKYGRVDILVNNAGIQHVCPIDEFP